MANVGLSRFALMMYYHGRSSRRCGHAIVAGATARLAFAVLVPADEAWRGEVAESRQKQVSSTSEIAINMLHPNTGAFNHPCVDLLEPHLSCDLACDTAIWTRTRTFAESDELGTEECFSEIAAFAPECLILTAGEPLPAA